MSHNHVEKADELWHRLRYAVSDMNCIAVASPDDTYYCFRVMELVELSHIGQKVRLVKLHNHWTKDEWEGDWSPNSTQWSHDLRQQHNHSGEKYENQFYINIDDYMTHFRNTTICYQRSASTQSMNKHFTTSETHEFANSTKKVDSADTNYAHLTAERHQAYFKIDINGIVNL